MQETLTLVVGASVAGLASATSLQKRGLEFTVIEKESQTASPWRHHYDRLHLHTNKRVSNLPYKKFAGNIPRYPTRQQVVDYLDDYAKTFDVKPVFNTEVKTIRRESNYWIAETSGETFKANYVVMATGAYGNPRPVHFPGMESFPGRLVHSSDYKTGKDFRDQNVLVVGFGNSACEIALDLYEQGARPCMSVRSPVNIIPRDVAGIPILELAQFMSRLPPRLADAINAPLMRLLFGDITKLGLQKKRYGAFEEIRKDRNIPVLDIGTLKHIRKGHIRVYGPVQNIEESTVHFADGKTQAFDAIVACIGFDAGHAEKILAMDKSRFDDLKVCVDQQAIFGKDGLYFCGFWVGPKGHIRQIALDAQKIAKDIAKKESLLNK